MTKTKTCLRVGLVLHEVGGVLLHVLEGGTHVGVGHLGDHLGVAEEVAEAAHAAGHSAHVLRVHLLVRVRVLVRAVLLRLLVRLLPLRALLLHPLQLFLLAQTLVLALVLRDLVMLQSMARHLQSSVTRIQLPYDQ